MIRVAVGCILFALAAGTASPVLAGPGQWQLLGERKVKFSAEKDTIVVTRAEGKFRRIKLKVQRNGVDFIDVKVHYRNGDVQDVKMRGFIRAGGETRVIDLPGKRRVIKKVVFTYRSGGAKAKRAKVQLWGKH